MRNLKEEKRRRKNGKKGQRKGKQTRRGEGPEERGVLEEKNNKIGRKGTRGRGTT